MFQRILTLRWYKYNQGFIIENLILFYVSKNTTLYLIHFIKNTNAGYLFYIYFY